jgi:uncharacterized protein YbjT (DUF2867 family)
MALTSVLVLGPTGGFGKYILPELVRRKDSFQRIAAFVDTSRPQIPLRAQALQAYSENGIELVEGSLTEPDPACFSGK